MAYILSDATKRKILNIPSFKTDTYKIKSISTVKSNYGIGNDETIISYRVMPRILAKLETGGTVFTDKGVYRRLPSGYLSSDYVTYGVKYEDMVYYVPCLGYSEDRQPQLVGEYREKKTLSFWLTPVVGMESNEEIVDVFCSIILECAEQDHDLFEKHRETLDLMIKTILNKIDKVEGYLEPRLAIYLVLLVNDIENLQKLIRKGWLSDEQKEEALYAHFKYQFTQGAFGEAYAYLEDYSELMNDQRFMKRIDPIIQEAIDRIGIPDGTWKRDQLLLVCKKNVCYVKKAIPSIIDYYFRTDIEKGADKNSFREYPIDDAGKVFQEMEEKLSWSNEKDVLDEIQVILKSKIEEYIPQICTDWQRNITSAREHAFFLYLLSKPAFYRRAAKELIDHFCMIGEFQNAQNCIEEINSLKDNDVDVNSEQFVENLKNEIKDCEVALAYNHYQNAKQQIANRKYSDAIYALKMALEYDPENKEYELLLIQAELDDGRMNDVYKGICYCLSKSYDEESTDKLREMACEYGKRINKEMGEMYDLLCEKNYNVVKGKYNKLSHADQIGLSFYHYAILLECNEIVKDIDESNERVITDVCGYDIRCFGARKKTTDVFDELITHYDEDAIKLLNKYKWKKRGIMAKKIGNGILRAALGGMPDIDGETENEVKYVESKAALEERVESNRVDYADQEEALYEELYEELDELIKSKREFYTDQIEKTLSYSDLQSKLIYLIIKKPEWLNKIFHLEESKYDLYVEKDRFWYLPKLLIAEATDLNEDGMM